MCSPVSYQSPSSSFQAAIFPATSGTYQFGRYVQLRCTCISRTAQYIPAFEHRRRVPLFRQVLRGRQARESGASDQDTPAAALCLGRIGRRHRDSAARRAASNGRCQEEGGAPGDTRCQLRQKKGAGRQQSQHAGAATKKKVKGSRHRFAQQRSLTTGAVWLWPFQTSSCHRSLLASGVSRVRMDKRDDSARARTRYEHFW